MNLKFKHLSLDNYEIEVLKKINDEAFPINERLSFSKMISFSEVINSDMVGIYDDKIPIGFFLIIKNDKSGYINYFAIGKDFRSMGYGSSAIKKIVSDYEGLQIALDFEVLDKRANNYQQRVKRKKFYLNNGFHETGHYSQFLGQKFEIVCTKDVLDIESLKNLFNSLNSQNEAKYSNTFYE